MAVQFEAAVESHDVPEVVPRRRLVLVDPPAPDDPQVAGRNLVRRMVLATVIAVPVVVVVYIVMMAVALRGTDAPAGPVLLMGAGIGAFAALFWGFWFGIAASIREIEETEEHDRARILASLAEQSPRSAAPLSRP